MALPSAVLHFVNDKHNKTYEVAIVSAGPEPDAGYLVNFGYGAIGSKLTPGTKTKTPVTSAEATKIYTKLVNEKLAKRCECCGGVYSEVKDTDASCDPVARRAIQTAPVAVTAENHICELYEPIEVEQSGKYVIDPRFGSQRKYDGVRLTIEKRGDRVFGWNRKGDPTNVPAQLMTILLKGPDVKLDGEWEMGRYVAFDMLSRESLDLSAYPLSTRHQHLVATFPPSQAFGGLIEVAALAVGEDGKRLMIEEEHKRRGEGVIFKDLTAKYMPGRLKVNVKLKFWKSATLRVGVKAKKDADKDSIAVEARVETVTRNPSQMSAAALESGAPEEVSYSWVNVGRVTMIGHEIPETGTFVEIRYLYLGAGARLFQPCFLGVRTDVDESDCAFSQLIRSGKDGNGAK